MPRLPTSTKALVVRKATGSPSSPPAYKFDAVIEHRPLPPLEAGEILVKINAVGFNHRDLWIRKGLYPGITIGSVFGGDGAGEVVAAADPQDPLLHKRVFLVPMRGWEKDPDAPEDGVIVIMGGSVLEPGTFAHYAVVDREQVIRTPDHLDDIHAAVWPVGAVTAWRATIINARVSEGDAVLITGIGGGVAILAMQICLARGATVYVTSGQDDKIGKAVALGAKAGFNYKDDKWPAKLAETLRRDGVVLSAVIDSGGGDIMRRTSSVLKMGGRVVTYGMTAEPVIGMSMREVLKNHQLIGSTMGSHKDLVDATNFLAQHKLVPVVSTILDGLEAAEQGFDLIARGQQFGKVAIKMKHEPRAQL